MGARLWRATGAADMLLKFPGEEEQQQREGSGLQAEE